MERLFNFHAYMSAIRKFCYEYWMIFDRMVPSNKVRCRLKVKLSTFRKTTCGSVSMTRIPLCGTALFQIGFMSFRGTKGKGCKETSKICKRT
jgi:hypothetical protein